MYATVAAMPTKKSESEKPVVQVRLPRELVADAGLVARAFGLTTPAWIEKVLAEAVAGSLPRVAELVRQRLSKRKAE